jgi:hypothetical protein
MSISSSAEKAMKNGYITGLHTDNGNIEPSDAQTHTRFSAVSLKPKRLA